MAPESLYGVQISWDPGLSFHGMLGCHLKDVLLTKKGTPTKLRRSRCMALHPAKGFVEGAPQPAGPSTPRLDVPEAPDIVPSPE